MKYICVSCGHRFSRKGDFAWKECPKCKGDAWWEGSSKFSGGFVAGVDVPQKGSPEWYKGKWFRRTEREWQDDIKSRVTLPDGKVVRKDGRFN